MEDMARLALVEQNVRDMDTFSKILYELLRHITHILENPHDYEIRTIRNEGLKKYFQYEALIDYLISIGFQSIGNEYTYPKEHTLNNLRLAQAAIERKIYFCCGSLKKMEENIKSLHVVPRVKESKLLPVYVLKTDVPLLRKIEVTFNDVLQYEDEELQAHARELVPLVTLQLMALDDMREHQRKIKTGEIKGRDMPFDIALLKVLLSWYKHQFFTWVDQPDCDKCGAETKHYKDSTFNTGTETCNLEIFRCTACGALVEFPRYRRARTLLRTRRGRCGEWASCFTLLCRALGYETRLVYSTSDHVWCEVWDYDSNQWLHADPCECLLDAPLTYSHGWGKQIDYVFAFSRDDLQDVTWRYTTSHKEVLKRRTESSEAELLGCIMSLREARQRQVSDARRRYLAKRCLEELAQLLTERKAGGRELHGRVSGAAAWRSARGELRPARSPGHVFRFPRAGDCRVLYCSSTDRYEIENGEEKEIQTWSAGVYNAQQVFRKVEKDWKMVYLAREEGAAVGTVSWMVRASEGTVFSTLSVRAHSATYEDGRVHWTVQLDDQPPTPIDPTEHAVELAGRFSRALITARLCGGRGEGAGAGVEWQHAQLFRAPLALTSTHSLLIQATNTHDKPLQ